MIIFNKNYLRVQKKIFSYFLSENLSSIKYVRLQKYWVLHYLSGKNLVNLQGRKKPTEVKNIYGFNIFSIKCCTIFYTETLWLWYLRFTNIITKTPVHTRPGAERTDADLLRLLHDAFSLLNHFPEPLLLLIFIQNGVLRHAGLLASLVSTLFALFPVLEGDLAAS
jgi:hypothetical protein